MSANYSSEATMMGLADVLVLWLHLVAAAIWVGGIAFLGIVLQPTAKTLIADPIERSRFLSKVGVRFNLVGWGSLLLAAGTGLYNLGRVSGGLENATRILFGTGYGMILSAKITLVLAMALITAHHTFIAGPKVRRLIEQLENMQDPSDRALLEGAIGRMQMRNGVLMAVLALFALATLFLAAMLQMSF